MISADEIERPIEEGIAHACTLDSEWLARISMHMRCFNRRLCALSLLCDISSEHPLANIPLIH